MGFFSSLVESFTGAFGKREDLGMQGMSKSMLTKLKFWCLVTVFFWILYGILYLSQCSKPEGGDGVCLLSENNGNINTFKFDISNLSTGGECGAGSPYETTGQGVDWIDTGYVTNGKQLIVYVNGDYFPWGEKQTPTTFGYHVTNIQTGDGKIQEGLNITQDYKECELNTDIKYSASDNLDTKIIYENHLNSYTSANSNNRNENRGKILIDNNIQGDCIIGNNCKAGLANETQTACVLKHGAGIYMKIGIDAPFSYHIKNYFIPDYDIKCTNGDNCTYQYKTSNAGETYNLIQVPYAIPPVIYKKGANTNGFIWDIRDNVMKNLQILQDYDKETEYKFYTLVRVPNDEDCKGDDYQKINGACYHSEQKKMTHEEIKNVNCPTSSIENINLPDELCAPQSGKRIYIKPADTCYEDNTGEINLTFTSGVKTAKKDDFSYRLDGIHITWFQDFVSVLFEPFFGSQNDKYEISDILETGYPKYDKTEGTITVCMSAGGAKDVLYLSRNNGDWIVKTEKYAVHGLKIKDTYDVTKTLISDGMIVNSDFKIPTTETMNAFYTKNNKCIVFAIKDEFKSKEKNKYQIIKGISDYTTEEVRSTTTTLVRFANMEDGLFIKVRNAIMSTSVYHIARIMVIVWFVFSFGVGFVNKEKMLSRVPLITSDWKRFLILLWCSDPDNYEFIDKYLWNGLIYGAQSFSAGILDAVSRVYGTSIVADEPMAFFDEVIASITSKEVFYKLGAVATSQWSGVLFLFLFPFFANGVIDFILAVIGPIVSLGFTMFNFSSIIMFMPLYALISLFGGQNQDKFQVAMKTLISEFVHFAFSLGFFGACIGFIYHYFLEVINVKVCWTNYSEYSFFNLINIKLGDWRICSPGSALEAETGERFKIIWEMIKATFEFTMVLSILGKFSIKISEQLTSIFANSGTLSLSSANEIYSSFKEIFSTVLGNINTKFDQNETKQVGNKMVSKKYKEDKKYSNKDDDGKVSDKNDKNFVKRTGIDDGNLNKNFDTNFDVNRKTNVKKNNEDAYEINSNNNEQIRANQINNDKNEHNDIDMNSVKINDNTGQKHLNVDNDYGVRKKYSYKENEGKNNDLNAHNNQDIYRGSGIQENQLGLKNNDDIVLKENDLGLQNNDIGLHDSISGDVKNYDKEKQQIEDKLDENKIKEKEIEKKINSFNKQISEWKKASDDMNVNQDETNQKSLAERTLEAIEQQKRDNDIKLKTLKNDDWFLKKKNK